MWVTTNAIGKWDALKYPSPVHTLTRLREHKLDDLHYIVDALIAFGVWDAAQLGYKIKRNQFQTLLPVPTGKVVDEELECLICAVKHTP